MEKKIILSFILLFTLCSVVKADDEITNAYVQLNEAYAEYNGACNNEERLAIIDYADGNIDRLIGGYDTVINLRTRSGSYMSFECANGAGKLYEAIMNANSVISSADITLDVVNLTSNVEVMTNLLVTGSKLKIEDGMTILDDCNLISNEFKAEFDKYFGYFQVFAIAMAVIFCVLDIYKIIISGKAENKKSFKSLTKRLIAVVVILLLPLIVNIVISLINSYVSVDAIKCLES